MNEKCDKNLELRPVDMTEEVMKDLERRGLIIRMCPHAHDLDVKPGEAACKTIYEPKEGFGPHKLISVTVNCGEFAEFGVHPDCEEFLMIGDAETQQLYLAVALVSAEELSAKISAGTAAPEDFIALRVRYNDPYASFFVMKAGVPHGEAIVPEAGKRPPSFYVTESRDLHTVLTDFGGCKLKIAE